MQTSLWRALGFRRRLCFCLSDVYLLNWATAQAIFVKDGYRDHISPWSAVQVSHLGFAYGDVAISKVPLIAGDRATPRLGPTGIKGNWFFYLNRLGRNL